MNLADWGQTMDFWIFHFGPISGHKSGHIATRGTKVAQLIEKNVVHLFKSKSQDLWAGFWVSGHQSWLSAILFRNFGPILGHKSGRVETRGPKFWHVVESIVVHLFKSKAQDLWTGFWVIGPQSWKLAIWALFWAISRAVSQLEGQNFYLW